MRALYASPGFMTFNGSFIVTNTAKPQAALGGQPFMMIYFAVCIITFIFLIYHIFYERNERPV